jgi:hypothetical protein
MQGEHSTASADLGGDDFVQITLVGTVGGATAEASVVAPIPGVLGDESSSSEGEDGGGGNASTPNHAEVESAGHRPLTTPLIEESKDEPKHGSPSTQPSNPMP